MNTASLCLCGQLLTNADATTQTIGSVVQTISCADTLAPGSAAHTVPGRAGATFTTIVTSNPALSDTAVDTAMQILIANNVDQAGVNKPVGGDFVLVVAENSTMIKKAQQLTGSSLSPETANNAVNVYSGGKMDFVVLKHGARNAAGQYETTNTNQYHWLLSTKKSLKRNLRYRWAAKPSIPNQGLFPKYMEKNLDSRIYMFARLVYGRHVQRHEMLLAHAVRQWVAVLDAPPFVDVDRPVGELNSQGLRAGQRVGTQQGIDVVLDEVPLPLLGAQQLAPALGLPQH